MKKLKILILIKKFGDSYPKHQHKFDMIQAIEEVADVKYWHADGNIFEIIEQLQFEPDFIFHYDIAWQYTFSPNITGLGKIRVPKGCFVIDTHWSKDNRIKYFETNKMDLIFSVTRDSFNKTYPQYIDKHRWMPFSINPQIIRDYGLDKTIDFLLMGLVYIESHKYHKYRPVNNAPKCTYSFREAVLNKMENIDGFVYVPHPGHITPQSKGLIVNENYAKKINESRIFFTCGSRKGYPVAKFFEGPGCKTLLLAKPNKDILDLGFKDSVNFIACDEKDFYNKALYYQNNAEPRERITTNGYHFIHSHHTNKVRAQQFISYIEDFLYHR